MFPVFPTFFVNVSFSLKRGLGCLHYICEAVNKKGTLRRCGVLGSSAINIVVIRDRPANSVMSNSDPAIVDLFVSYKRENRNWVKQLVLAFQEHSWGVRWDQDLPYGADYPKVLCEWVATARGVVLVWSAGFIDDDRWLSRETERHWEQGTLFIVRADDSPLSNRFKGIQAGDFTKWSGQSKSPDFQKLLKSVSNKLRVSTGSGRETARAGSYSPDKPVFDASPESRPTAEAGLVQSGEADVQQLRASEAKDAHPDAKPDGEEQRKRPEPTSAKRDDADPTTEFPKGAGLYHYTDPEDRDKWSARLLWDRSIAVRSPDDDITVSAIEALLGTSEIRDYFDHRLLKFNPDNRKRTDLSLSELVHRRVGDPNRATLVVVDPYKSLSFIDSTLGGSLSARSTTVDLRQQEFLVVIQIGSRYRADFDRRRDSFKFECWDINWLPALLALHFPPNDVPTIIDRLKTRREKGNWGKPGDEYEFHAILQSVLADGPPNLIDTLNRQEKA